MPNNCKTAATSSYITASTTRSIGHFLQTEQRGFEVARAFQQKSAQGLLFPSSPAVLTFS
eukprot:scaffold178141_cov35-Attheya_sp.AAC.3